MRPKRLLGLVPALLAAMVLVAGASRIELYMDPETKQVFGEDGPGRIKLGTFERVEDEAEASVEPDQEEHEPVRAEEKAPAKPERPAPARLADLSYEKDGFTLETSDGRFSLAIQNRIQVRYANPFDRDPRTPSDVERDQSSFMIRRARTKLRGHAYWPWLEFSMQYDWAQPVLRDLNLTVAAFEWAELWVGRGKVVYNDERVTSSGNQQFVNRSIVNDVFTVDRQQGVRLSGNLFSGTWHDVSYFTGVYAGAGVGERDNDDAAMMYSARLQWNALGGEMRFSQSDVEFHEEPALSFAFAAATNRSRCTAFETDSDSCRSLPGFEIGEDGQFRVEQMVEEARFKWRGLSILHEFHWKQVTDRLFERGGEAQRRTRLEGAFVQAGYFPHHLIPVVPRHLELAGRWAFVDPNHDFDHDLQKEASGVVTYFLAGHSNKLSFQVSHLSVEEPVERIHRSTERFWLQWDLTF